MRLKYWSYAAFAFSLVFLGKVSGLFKDLLFTYYYGVSDITDSYFLANSLSSLLYIAIYSAVPVVMVPLYSRLVGLGQPDLINARLTRSLLFFVLISLALGGAVAVSASVLVDFFAGKTNAVVKELAGKYLVIMAMTFVLSTVVAFLNALQTVQRRRLPSYVVPLMNNLMFCLGLYYFGSTGDLTEVLYLGVVAWFMLLLANWYMSRQYFSLNLASASTVGVGSPVWLLFLPAVLSFYVEQINGFVGVYFASNLSGGAISVLGYAGKLNLIFQSLFTVFLTTSIFPNIAALVARKDSGVLSAYLNRCMRAVVFCALPLIAFMIYYSFEIVELLFKRGKFDESDVRQVSAILSILLLAVPFGLWRDTMNRLLFSYGKNTIPVALSLQALGVNAVVSFFSYQAFGLKGIAWAVVLSASSNVAIAIYIIKRDLGIALIRPNLRSFIIALLGASVAVTILAFLAGQWGELWFLSFVPFMCVYVAVLCLLRAEECAVVFERVRRIWLSR